VVQDVDSAMPDTGFALTASYVQADVKLMLPRMG
jgi:hypothetical protein